MFSDFRANLQAALSVWREGPATEKARSLDFVRSRGSVKSVDDVDRRTERVGLHRGKRTSKRQPVRTSESELSTR